MKKIKIFLFGIIGFCCSCTETSEGFLDSKGSESENLTTIFADSLKTEQFHAVLYNQIGRVPMTAHNSTSLLQDYKSFEAAADNSRVNYYSISEFTPAFQKGDFSLGGGNANFTDFRRAWEEPYRTIYRVNVFLANIDNAPFTQARKDRYILEARFIRAFFYFHLLRQFGAIPLMYDEISDPFDPPKKARNTFEEVVNYIAEELEAAASGLPLVQEGKEYGRPTKASALGVLNQLYQLAASPLHNGGNIGSGANRALVGYESYDVNRWKKVLETADRLIALGTNDLVVDNETRPGNGFYLAATKRKSEERIWFWLTVAHPFPGKHFLPPSRNSNALRIYPYHELTEAYPMINGLPITDPESGYDNNNPYANRDPRFNYTIIYNGALWPKTVNGKPEPVYTYNGATQDGYGVKTPTGYYFRNGVNESHLGNTSDPEGKGLSFIRFSHILFSCAEAWTELDVNANRSKIEQYLFKIRERAGIEPGVNGRYGIPEKMNKDEMIDFIMNERRIEFANETGDRFWDLKRRKLFHRLDGKYTSAAVWEKQKDGSFTWSVVGIDQHFFHEKMYFNAIPQSEVNATNGLLIQNPGW